MWYKNNTAAVVQARHGTSAQTFAPHRTQRFSTSELCKAGELASSTVCGARYSQETDETTWEENDGADDTAYTVLLGHVVVARGTEVHHCATTQNCQQLIVIYSIPRQRQLQVGGTQ